MAPLKAETKLIPTVYHISDQTSPNKSPSASRSRGQKSQLNNGFSPVTISDIFFHVYYLYWFALDVLNLFEASV